MVGNDDVARVLERIAGLLEIRGENVFKVRAYRTAVAQIENLGESLVDLHQRGELLDLPGFGEAIAAKVEELLTTGRLPYLEALEAEVPPSLLDIRALPGIGPKTAATIWHEAGVTTVDDLESAARAGRLDGLPRMGRRSVDKLIAALDARHTTPGHKDRRARSVVEPLATSLLDGLRAVPSVERAEVAGSYRRGRQALGDLDLLAATRQPVRTLEAFATLPGVERVLLRGDTKCSVHVAGGFQVDCRAVAPEEFGAAWQYFTGSQAHNIRLRALAQRLGLTVNEYGVYRVEGMGRIAGQTEEDVYAALGLDWIAPEDREDRGELEIHRRADPVGRQEASP